MLTTILAGMAGIAGQVASWRSPLRAALTASEAGSIYLPIFRPRPPRRALILDEQLELIQARLALGEEVSWEVCEIGGLREQPERRNS